MVPLPNSGRDPPHAVDTLDGKFSSLRLLTRVESPIIWHVAPLSKYQAGENFVADTISNASDSFSRITMFSEWGNGSKGDELWLECKWTNEDGVEALAFAAVGRQFVVAVDLLHTGWPNGQVLGNVGNFREGYYFVDETVRRWTKWWLKEDCRQCSLECRRPSCGSRWRE